MSGWIPDEALVIISLKGPPDFALLNVLKVPLHNFNLTLLLFSLLLQSSDASPL
jgi:hypothetical protein